MIENQSVFHTELFFLRAKGIELFQSGSLKSRSHPDNLPDFAAFHFFHGNQAEGFISILISSSLQSAPRIPFIPVNADAAGAFQGIVAFRSFVLREGFFHKGYQRSGLCIELRPDEIIFQNIGGGIIDFHMIIAAQCRLSLYSPVHGKPKSGNMGTEHKTPSSAKGSMPYFGVCMDSLVRDFLPVCIQKLKRSLAEPFQFGFHIIIIRLAVRIKQHQGKTFSQRGKAVHYFLDGQRLDFSGSGTDTGHLHDGFLPGLFDGGSSHGIMEFIK